MIFGISETKRTVLNREVSVLYIILYRGVRKERLDCIQKKYLFCQKW